MENPNVKFRRGGSNLPTVTDGYITLNSENGKMYADVESDRIAVAGYLFGICDTPADIVDKIVEIPGVPAYFDGLIVTVVFEHIDKLSTENLKLSICYGDEPALEEISLMVDPTTQIAGVDIEENVPYTFTYKGGQFLLVSGNLGARPKWKRLTDKIGY